MDNYFFKRDITFSNSKGIAFSFLISLGWFIINSLIYFFNVHNLDFLIEGFNKSFLNIWFFIVVLVSGFFIQEILRSILLNIYANVPFNSQLFVFSINSFMPYVESKYPIPIKKYFDIYLITSICLLPLIFISYMFQKPEWIWITSTWIFFDGFNVYTLFLMYKHIDKNLLCANHPTLPGCVIYDNPFENQNPYEK